MKSKSTTNTQARKSNGNTGGNKSNDSVDIIHFLSLARTCFDILEFVDDGCIVRMNYDTFPSRDGEHELVKRIKNIMPSAIVTNSGRVQDQKRTRTYQWWATIKLENISYEETSEDENEDYE